MLFQATLSCQTPQFFSFLGGIANLCSLPCHSTFSFIFSVQGRVTWGKEGVFIRAISLSIYLKSTATFCLTTKTVQNLFIFRLASARYFAVTWKEMRPVVWHKQGTCFLNAIFLRSNVKHETSSLFFGRRGKQEFSKASKHEMPSVSTSLWLSVGFTSR